MACTRLILDPLESARAARLRYVTDDMPGIRRIRAGRGFRYLDPDGRTVRDPEQLRRIRSLVIPPAWRDVWICRIPSGHLQATGRDARGRKQYRYHPRWRETRDETKFGKMVAFGEKLPRIRRRIARDLGRRRHLREKVLAAVVRLLELTCIRVGNEEYARMNQSFGLTTLRDRHVDVSGANLEFRFRGKSGREHAVTVTDKRLARIVKRCQDMPGYILFQYIDEDGQKRIVDSGDVNEYVRSICGEEFTAKDFRTWAGTVQAVAGLQRCGPCSSARQTKKNLLSVIRDVADQLGNTPAVCRRCYIHPSVIDGYLDGSLLKAIGSLNGQNGDGLRSHEKAVLAFLRKCIDGEQRRNNPATARFAW
jgi:DNA topoisomerase-1